MATQDAQMELGRDGRLTRAASRSARVGNLRDVVKFAALAAVLAMVGDAVVAHAIFWHNDPYWTYWVTDTFLMTTIFAVGTALFGIGIGRGLALTAVQTLVLTTYYWSLSPIGLPAHPQWLDLQHTWITGVPVHFGIYYLGYLGALWLWRRHSRTEAMGGAPGDAWLALVTSGAIVGVAGLLQTLMLGDFPGVTWFIMRLVVLVPFTLAWWAMAGHDRSAAVGGGIVASFLLAAYTHYLGPVGLPATDLRVIAQDPPPSPVTWLTYREEFLVILPITVLVAVVAFLVASLMRGYRWTALGMSRRAALATTVSIIALIAAGAAAASGTSTAHERARVTASEQAGVEQGEYYRGDLIPAEADLRLTAESRNTKQTPLPPNDLVELHARVVHPKGTVFDVTATQSLVSDPRGQFGTWGGVGYDRWHHGRSGVGTSQLPATRSDVAVYALGDVRADGELIATGVPMHAMTVGDRGMELHVGDPGAPLPAMPDGHLRVVWSHVASDVPERPEVLRNVFGGVLLVALLCMAVAAVRSQD